ncbi:MAG: YibE/F family protein [Thermoleophilaceae bacterium]
MLIFSSASIDFLDTVNLELIAREVVATLVGSIGLIAAVPITTALAALMAGRIPVEDLPAEDHTGHAH